MEGSSGFFQFLYVNYFDNNHWRTSQRMSLNCFVKDNYQKFYRRNGSIWTDYIHTAPDRLHLVLNDKIINADKKAAEPKK